MKQKETPSTVQPGVQADEYGMLNSIARHFHVSLNDLDVERQIRPCDLSSDERDFLNLYRQLSGTDKEKIKSYIDGLQVE